MLVGGDNMEGMKVCSNCGVEKGLDEFGNQKQGKFGKNSMCKICKKEYSHLEYIRNKETYERYREENKDKIKLNSKEYRSKNKDMLSERRSIIYTENPEKFRKKSIEYARKHPEKKKEWLKNNPDYMKKYHEENRDWLLEQGAKHRKNNPEEKKEWGIKNRAHVKSYNEDYKKDKGKELSLYGKNYTEDNRNKLTDVYIKGLLHVSLNISSMDITPGLIIAKRAQLKLRRAINSVC